MTCKALREISGVGQSAVAAVAGMDTSTIYRFEQNGTWPREPDEFIAAYAKTAGLPDARDLWDTALRRWRAEGAAPEIPTPEPRSWNVGELEQEIDAYLSRRES